MRRPGGEEAPVIYLTIAPGSHPATVGPSDAGHPDAKLVRRDYADMLRGPGRVAEAAAARGAVSPGDAETLLRRRRGRRGGT
jgi:hypothetical protein